MNKPVAYWDGKHFASKDKSSLADIPVYTQDQLEEARKLGMQQERALWNLTESTQEIMNKPVAWLMVDRDDGNSYIQMGEPTRDEKVSHQPYPLYTAEQLHPVKELNDGGEPVKNATYWKRQHDNLLMKLNTCAIKVSELEKKAHPVKELTDEEITDIGYKFGEMGLNIQMIRAILRKAQEK